MKIALIGRPEPWLEAFNWPNVSKISEEYDYFLVQEENQWGLLSKTHPEFNSFSVNFNEGSYKNITQKGLSKSDPLKKAIGQKKGPLNILDATAGWLKDSWRLLSLGHRVTACEKNKLVYVLNLQAVKSINSDDKLSNLVSRLSLKNCDASEILLSSNVQAWDVVYIDPMFPKISKSSLAGKEMQLLQSLISHTDSGEDLLVQALASGIPRVVVKRPLKGLSLLKEPNYKVKSKASRFDVYLNDI